jgi:hypothetical protein
MKFDSSPRQANTTSTLFLETLLVLLVTRTECHTSVSEAPCRQKTGTNGKTIERGVKDQLPKRSKK